MSRKHAQKEDPIQGLIVGGLLLVFLFAWAKGTIGVAVLIALLVVAAIAAASRSKQWSLSDRQPAVTSAPTWPGRAAATASGAVTDRAAGTIDDDAEEWSDDLSLYSLRRTFFNRSENAFYRALLRAVQDRYWVFPKVRLLDICNDIPGNVYSARNRIWAKHVDFLLCHPASLIPVAAIEVDGSSHDRRDRADSDAFKDALFTQLGIPLIRVPASSWFEPADVRRRIEGVLPASQPALPS